jgi:excisionase family DNA binding protein
MDKLISTKEAAERLGITSARVQQLIWKGRLPATQVGRAYIIREEDLKLVTDRKPGRPSQKSESKPASKRKEKGKR